MNAYNLTPYNLGANGEQKIIRNFKIKAVVSINGVIGVGRNLRMTSKYDISINGTTKLFIRKLLHVEAAVNINAAVLKLRKNILFAVSGDLDIAGNAAIGKRIYVKSAHTAHILGAVRLGKKIYDARAHNIDVLTVLKLGKKIYTGFDAEININALLQLSAYDYDTLTINISVPAGEEIFIDSDNRTIFMGGQNVFYARDEASDWIYLFRETAYLQLGAGSGGNLSGTLQYSPRYL